MQNKMQSIIVEKMKKEINSKYTFGGIVKMEILSRHIVVIHVQNQLKNIIINDGENHPLDKK